MLNHQTIAYEARHMHFPFLGVSKPTRGACERYIMHRPYPGARRLVRLIDTGAGGILEREMQQGSHLS